MARQNPDRRPESPVLARTVNALLRDGRFPNTPEGRSRAFAVATASMQRRGLLVPGTRKHTHRGAAMEGAELRRPGHAKTMRDYERRIRQTKDNMVHGREIRGPFLSPDEYASGYAYDHAWAELEDRKIQARRALWCGVSVARAALEHLKAQGAITFEDAEAIGEVLNLCALYTAAGAEVERDQRTRMLRLANNVQGKHANAVHDLAWTVMQLATYCNDEWKPAQQRDSVRHNTQALPRVLSVGRSLKEGQSDAIRVLRAAASGDLPEPPPARQRSKASLRTKANDVRGPRGASSAGSRRAGWGRRETGSWSSSAVARSERRRRA